MPKGVRSSRATSSKRPIAAPPLRAPSVACSAGSNGARQWGQRMGTRPSPRWVFGSGWIVASGVMVIKASLKGSWRQLYLDREDGAWVVPREPADLGPGDAGRPADPHGPIPISG